MEVSAAQGRNWTLRVERRKKQGILGSMEPQRSQGLKAAGLIAGDGWERTYGKWEQVNQGGGGGSERNGDSSKVPKGVG